MNRPSAARVAWVTALVLLSLGWAAQPQEETAAEAFVCPPCGGECHFKTAPKPGTCGGCGMELVPLASVPQAGVLLYPGVGLVSSTLPLGVLADSNALRAFTVADTADLLRSRDTLDMKPQFAFADAPPLDVLVIPDGYGAHEDPLVLEWVQKSVDRARYVLAIGMGSVVLSGAGFLEGVHAPATRFLAQRGKELAPDLVFDPELRLVHEGKFFLARDDFASVDGVLAILSELVDEECARRTAETLGYAWIGEQK